MPIIGLDEADATCGGKALGLGLLSRSGFNVPNGFVVVGDLDALALGAAVDRLGAPMAVRSSGLLEDSATASFAGQLQTVLGVVGSAEAAAAILACGRSGTADRVRAYAVRTGAATPPRVPVVVQRLVAAEVAGVVFTQDPRTGLDDVVIEAAWGLGGSVVDGQVVPDRFTVSALGTVEGSVGSKATRLDWRDGELIRSAVPTQERRRAALTHAQIREIAGTAREAHGALGYPLDIEWAISGDTLWLLQARPITTASSPPGSPAARPALLACRRRRLSHHAYLDQPVEILIDVLGPVGSESVLLVEPSSPRVVLGHPQLCGPLAESLVKESLTDTVAVAAGQHVERIQLLIALRRVPLVVGGRTVRDQTHDPAFAPGDTEPLSGILP